MVSPELGTATGIAAPPVAMAATSAATDQPSARGCTCGDMSAAVYVGNSLAGGSREAGISGRARAI